MYLVTHTFICKECKKEANISYRYEKYQPQNINFPIGWSELPDGYICDNHIITVTDKVIEETVISELEPSTEET